METRVALMEETWDERTRPREGKAIGIVTPRSSLHPSPDCVEVQHPDPASGKALKSADRPPARGATGPHTPAYPSLSSGLVRYAECSSPPHPSASCFTFHRCPHPRKPALLFIFLILFYLTLQYCIGFAIYQNESATGIHVFPILNPPSSSRPIPSLWVVPVHQPQASSIVHRTWTGDSFHILYRVK